MPPETGKQLTVGYFILSFFFTLSLGLSLLVKSTWWPVDVVVWFSDPIVKLFLSLVFLAFVPGVIAVGIVGVAIVICGYAAILAILVPVWIIKICGSISTGGFVLGLILTAIYIGLIVQLVREKGPELFKEGTKYVQTIIEFFAWLSVAADQLNAAMVGENAKAATLSVVRPVQKSRGGASMGSENDLNILRAEIVTLTNRYPELPAFHNNGYGGWFNEAKKRFAMQSYNQTQDERIAVAKRIAELNDLYLRILRQQGEKSTFEQEQRIRGKRLNVEEVELDYKMEDLIDDREQKLRDRKKAAESPPTPSPPPRNPVDEELSKIRRTLRTVVGVKAECEQLEKEYPTQATYIRGQCRKIVEDLMERA